MPSSTFQVAANGDDIQLGDLDELYHEGFEEADISNWSNAVDFEHEASFVSVGNGAMKFKSDRTALSSSTDAFGAITPDSATVHMCVKASNGGIAGDASGNNISQLELQTGGAVTLIGIRVRDTGAINRLHFEYLHPAGPTWTTMPGEGIGWSGTWGVVTITNIDYGAGTYDIDTNKGTPLVGAGFVNAGATMGLLEYSSQSSENARYGAIDEIVLYDDTTVFNAASASLELGGKANNNSTDIVVKFDNVTIPNGAIIRDSYFKITSDRAAQDADVTSTFRGNDVDSAASPGNYAAAQALVSTTSKARWYSTGSEPDWGLDEQVDLLPLDINGESAKLIGIIQEIVDRPGWSSGNNVQFYLPGSAQQNNRDLYRSWYSRDGDSAKDMELFVDWDVLTSERVDADRASYLVEVDPTTPYFGDLIYHNDLSGDVYRGVASFDISGVTADLKNNVTQAVLKFRSEGQSPSSPTGKTVNIHKLDTDFVEAEVTWNEYSSGNSWTSPGGDFGAGKSPFTQAGDNLGSYLNVVVTNLADWSALSRVSFIIKFNDETITAPNDIVFYLDG